MSAHDPCGLAVRNLLGCREFGSQGTRSGRKEWGRCSVTGVTLGLCNHMCILTPWRSVVEKQIGLTPHHVLLFSHREWGRPAGTPGYTTSPSDMTVSNWLDLRWMEPFQWSKAYTVVLDQGHCRSWGWGIFWTCSGLSTELKQLRLG